MGVIKGVLKEELDNAVRMKKNYEKALKAYSGGCFVQKKIRGHKYYYLAVREGKKVKFIYQGKQLAKENIANLAKRKQFREKYKGLIKKLNSRIKYLKKVLHGKEDV